MESSNDSSGGPAVLQLQKWGQFLQLSEFSEAFISPTRERLLLLSYEYEALLLPLIAGTQTLHTYSFVIPNNIAISVSQKVGLQVSGERGFRSGPFPSAGETTDTSDSFDGAPCTSESAEAAPNSEFQHQRSSLAFEYCPVIPDVRSVAWGHCGDGYDRFEDSDFREFLIVSGDNDIIVHAFRCHDKNANNRRMTSENGDVRGEWVKWEPSHSAQSKEQLLHPDNSEISFALNSSRAMGKNVHDRSNNTDSFSNKQKHWFKTFLTELDTHVCDGTYVSMFPRKSTLPHSADVVSFSIYNSALLFLEFLFRTSIPEQDHNVETAEELRAETISSLTRTSDRSYPYKISKVFSSSSRRLIGLVLTSSDKSSAGNNEDHPDDPNTMLVVIVMLHHWGLQWICSVDLQDSYLALGPSWPWADFQFLENFLVCLNTCGLICIFEAKAGNLIARFDALDSLGLFTKMPSSDGNINKPNKLHINRTSTGELISHRIFKRLMVLPSSLLLGVVDDHGIVYIFHAGDYIPENHSLTEKYKHVFNHCDLGIPSNWNIAGSNIGSQRPFVDLSGHQALWTSNMPFEGFSFNGSTFRKRRKQAFQDKEGLPDTYVSGFSSASCTSGQKIFYSELSTKMRKVFLPLERPNNRDCICLSPFGVIRLVKSYSKKSQHVYRILCTDMHVGTIVDERHFCSRQSSMKEHVLLEESLGFSFQGSLYLVTARGLSVILPSISVSATNLPANPLRYMLPDAFTHRECENLLLSNKIRDRWRPWQVEILDRILLYDGFKEAEHVCLENGWDLRFACFRQMHLSLRYFMSDEIEKSLDMLADVNLAEEGVLQLLLVSAHQICQGAGRGSEVALACRLLALASRFATKMIRKYATLNHKENFFINNGKTLRTFYSKPSLEMQNVGKLSYSERLSEMAYYLEVIRDLLSRLASKNRRPVQALTDGRDATSVVEKDTVQSETSLPIVSDTSLNQVNSIGTLTKNEAAFNTHEQEFDDASGLAIEKVNSSEDSAKFHELCVHDAVASQRSSLIPLENPKDMILRWHMDKFDPKDIVKDALHVGRLPLAVLQLHLNREKKQDAGDENLDAFSEVQNIGKAIAYDLFLKGEGDLAVATLQRLGEDIELLLRQLLFGTLRRSLRRQLTEEMRQSAYLKPSELEVLEKIFLIERLYPSSSFWKSYVGRHKIIHEESSSTTLPKADSLILAFHVRSDLTIDCGDVDGVVIGSWASTSPEQALSATDEDTAHCGYWASAVVWSDAWEQRTWDRMVLDQPSHMGVYVSWESQLEYYISHNDLGEIFKLLDVIPISLMSAESLKVSLDTSYSIGSDGEREKTPDHGIYICAAEELEPVLLYIPQVKIFRSSSMNMCSSWLKVIIEEELARKYVFMKEIWHGSAEIMQLIARSGLFMIASKVSFGDKSSKDYIDLDILNDDNQYHKGTAEALNKLVVYHCAQYGLPCLLDLYLEHHYLPIDYGSLSSLLQAAGDCHWAKWLLSSRTKCCEYEASFYNLRSNLSQQVTYTNNLGVLELDEIIHTVDDVAEGRGELAALATLMYATSPLQKCICTGSVNKHSSSFSSSSFQCTLENLRPTIHHFPTIWRTLVASCSGQDANDFPFNCNSSNGKSAFDNYFNWRNSIFLSAGGDTSLEQMMPCTFPKSIRRLTKIFVQGPIGWQSLSSTVSAGESYNFTNINMNWNNGSNAISWEASIERIIEKELYSSLEDKGSGVEQNLHRGRALAAFNQILVARALSLKSSSAHQHIPGQSNIQSDVQAMLAPLSQSERSIVSSVAPLAIMHFEDPVMVASCMVLLELCGLSSSMLRVDISALKRISSYYRSVGVVEHYDQVSPKGSASAIHTSSYEVDSIVSLAQALADDHIRNDHLSMPKNRDDPSKNLKEPQSPSLITVLHHLERACLPSFVERHTCGSWLQTGIGNGSEFRSKQKDASQQWSLVTKFCQMHHLPLSTQYLALLAQDNDWVGFLTEAQVGSFPVDIIVQVAAEFSDPRLRTHIVNVLKSTQSTRRKANSLTTAPNVDNSTVVPPELFEIIAECERQEKPGEALLMKARDLDWCLLAMVASCFPDVSPLSCLTVWLEITAARETSTIKVDDFSSKIAKAVGAAVEVTNSLPSGSRKPNFHYNRRNPKRRCLIGPTSLEAAASNTVNTANPSAGRSSLRASNEDEMRTMSFERLEDSNDSDYGLASLSNMVAVLCEKHLFLPLLRAFEMFMPSCPLLPFIRSLQAFSQMRLSEASAHLTMFSGRIKEESYQTHKEVLLKTAWVSSTAVKAANTVLSRCPSAYEKRCLLQLLAATDFSDGGSASACFRRLYWKINLAEPSLRKDDDVYLGNETLDDESLLTALIKNGRWEQARNWARQLESSGPSWKSAPHQVTEAQAEAMVAEWMDFLWDVPEERAALWNHCQTLFVRYSFPPLQAGLFFLKHAEAIEKDIPSGELHEILLLSLQWLSGTITQSPHVYPLHLLREIETRVWLLAVESEAQTKAEGDSTSLSSLQNLVHGNSASVIDQTATIVSKMDNHINAIRTKSVDRNSMRDHNQPHNRQSLATESTSLAAAGSSTRTKRRVKSYWPSRRPIMDNMETTNEPDDSSNSPQDFRSNGEVSKSMPLQEGVKETTLSGWEERVRPAEMEKAVLSLLEFGQIAAAKQLQQKMSPENVPEELLIIDSALKIAVLSSSNNNKELSESLLDLEVLSVVQSADVPIRGHMIEPLQALESLADKCNEGCGRGLCWRIIAVVKAAKVLGLPFAEAFEKKPIELLQLLSLKAQDSFDEAKLLVQTHTMPPPNIAQVLAESFLKGLLAAHRGGYMDSQKEEGPAPLLWRFADFLKWAELCPSEPEIGHALMRLVMTGHEIPHACEVELLILSHHFYKSSACLDGVDVLVTLAANRVESYVLEGDFSCLSRLVTGVSNFYALNFILNILIENGQLELLLQRYSTTDMSTGTAAEVRGFRMAVLTSLKLFNPHDIDAFAMVYNHFDMKHETSSLLESRSLHYMQQWLSCREKDRLTEDLLEAMRLFIEAAEVLCTIDAGRKTHHACAKASLLSLQIRIPDIQWIELPEGKARNVLVEQSRFQEALILAEAYNLNQPSEWTPVLWNQTLKPDLIEQFIAEFVAVLPLHPTTLMELARFYRAEVAARSDQSHFSVWLTPGGLPAEWIKHLGRSFRSMLKRTKDLRLRMQLATVATGFPDIINACNKVMDKVPETAGPLVLRRGHGGAYLPLM